MSIYNHLSEIYEQVVDIVVQMNHPKVGSILISSLLQFALILLLFFDLFRFLFRFLLFAALNRYVFFQLLFKFLKEVWVFDVDVVVCKMVGFLVEDGGGALLEEGKMG
jgi:hypothetical protein